MLDYRYIFLMAEAEVETGTKKKIKKSPIEKIIHIKKLS
jgi:hypothetical protein